MRLGEHKQIETSHDRMVKAAGGRAVTTPAPRQERIEVDDVGLDKLASALESIAGSNEDLDGEVVRELTNALADVAPVATPKKG